MRGEETKQSTMLSLLSPEQRVPQRHPLRAIKTLADAALVELSPVFNEMYSAVGRPSIPPERLLKASLLMAFYTVRSERLFCEQLDYNLLFRWFLGMNMDERSFDPTVFTKNRERLLKHDVAGKFFGAIVDQARTAGLMSDEHFTVDGTLIEAWASLKSFRRKDEKPGDRLPPGDPGNPTIDFHGEKRSNETHESKTDPEARLARKGKGKEAKLAYSQHALMENRHGLLVELQIATASGTAERETAIVMLDGLVPGTSRVTLGADKGYDTRDFVELCKERNVTPHVAQNISARRSSAIDGRTTRHPGYGVSQVIRKRVEEIFGWFKTVANFRKTRFKGLERTQFASHLVGAAYNLMRIAKLLTPTPT
jgi:transposase